MGLGQIRKGSCHVTCSCPTEVRSFLPMLSLYSCSGIVRHMDGLQSCWLGQGCIATRDELQVDTWIFNHANMGCTMELLVGSKVSIAARDELQVATWTFNREIALYCVLSNSDECMEISYS